MAEKKKGNPNWVKGVSGNPNGRPKKGQTLTELAQEYLRGDYKGTEITRKQLFIERVYNLAIGGDSTCIKLLWGYCDGLPTIKIDQHIDVNKMDPKALGEFVEATVYDIKAYIGDGDPTGGTGGEEEPVTTKG